MTLSPNRPPPSDPPLPPYTGGANAQSVLDEHAVLARRLAALQRRVSEQCAQHADQLCRLEAEVVRLRGRLVQARTALWWRLPSAVDSNRFASSDPQPLRPRASLSALSEAPMAEARAVICQTGCTGHAHPWREPDGLCRRFGAACDAATQVPFGPSKP